MSGPHRIAIVHDWLTGMRGGERCLEVLCDLYPAADLFTLLHRRGSVSAAIEAHRITPSALQRLPGVADYYRYLLPLFPAAMARLDVSGYDLVISSSHCAAMGVRVDPGACHLAYIHTPMRYIWDLYDEYFGGRISLAGWVMPLLRGYLQRWDVATAQRPWALAANSHTVAERIRRIYGRAATVIHPPVRTHPFEASDRDDGYYLIVSSLVPYKRIDTAIAAFNRLRRPLRIVGDGPEARRLQRASGAGIEFLGWLSDDQVAQQLARCRALVFPGEEDFGIVPVEAMACGKAVIAYGRGGATETIVPLGAAAGRAPTGLFFDRPGADALIAAVERFERERSAFQPAAIRAHALAFSEGRFRERFGAFVDACVAQWESHAGVRRA